MSTVIPITSGIGIGPTPLSAFDNALFEAGIGNYNLIHLSSVVPLGHVPHIKQIDRNSIEQGHRLYVVYAAKSSETKGASVASGLGWVMAETKPSWGLFVEHHGETEDDVRLQIDHSLTHMTTYRSDYRWGEINSHIVSVTCTGQPVCALVAALYKSEEWT